MCTRRKNFKRLSKWVKPMRTMKVTKNFLKRSNRNQIRFWTQFNMTPSQSSPLKLCLTERALCGISTQNMVMTIKWRLGETWKVFLTTSTLKTKKTFTQDCMTSTQVSLICQRRFLTSVTVLSLILILKLPNCPKNLSLSHLFIKRSCSFWLTKWSLVVC